jgi:hypothetical protein
MKLAHLAASAFAAVAIVLTTASESSADRGYYAVVAYYAGGTIEIRTTAHSVGHWRVDGATRIVGGIAQGDWVFADVEPSGHVHFLRFEERPTVRSGVVVEVQGAALFVRSGTGAEEWNVVETTALIGIAPGQFRRGDHIGVKLYRNHNLAELQLIQRDVPIGR